MVLCKALRPSEAGWTQPASKRTCIDAEGTGFESDHGYVLSHCDEGMVQFVIDAFDNAGSLDDNVPLHEDVMSSLSWMSQHTAEETNARREAMISVIEADAAAL